MTTNNDGFPYDHHRPEPASRFFDRIRAQGLIRSDDRWFGGISGIIADRTGWNINLVRLLTVLLILCFGLGALLYGLAWAFLPEPDSRIHAQEVLSGRWSAGLLGSGILTLIGLGTPGFWTGPGLLLVLGALVWLIFNRTNGRSVNTPGNQNLPPDGR